MSVDPPSSGKPSKRPRTDNAVVRSRLEDLPRDVLATILGKLDWESLCSARPVSKVLCAEASSLIHSLTLPSQNHGVSFERFSNLNKLEVVQHGEAKTGWRGFPWLGPLCQGLITKLCVNKFDESVMQQIPLLPKLQSLVVVDLLFQYEGILLACTSLQSLTLGACTAEVANRVATMTQLTALHIDKVAMGLRAPERHFWLEVAPQMQNLQALTAVVSVEYLDRIARLTGLTGLAIIGAWTVAEEKRMPKAIAQLSTLTRLRDLSLTRTSEGNVGLACSLGAGRLTRLHLSVRNPASDNCWSPLTQHTALADLSVSGRQLPDLSHVTALRLGALRHIALDRLELLDGVGLYPLCGATSLTFLEVCFLQAGNPMTLSNALAGLKQLRSLELTQTQFQPPAKLIYADVALAPLTSLTFLKISCGPLDDGDLRALLALTRLRELHMRGWALTADSMYDVGTRLTSLRLLSLTQCGVSSLRLLGEVVNTLLEDRALPPMITELQ